MNTKMMVIIIMAIMAMAMTGCGDDATPTPDVVPSPAQQKQMLMDNAYERGETIFVWDAEQTTKYALYYGANHIVFLKPDMVRTIKLTSNETINLSVRKQHVDDTGDVTWLVIYSFQNLSPGDYVLFDGSWRVMTYNPANAITK